MHARPPVPLDTPEFVTYLAFLHHEGSAGREADHLATLAGQLGQPAPDIDSGHVLLEAEGFRLKWERHNEFSSYCFFRRIEPDDSPDDYALLHVPAAWRKAIPGLLIAATHIELRDVGEVPLNGAAPAVAPRPGAGRLGVSDGAGWVLTDFHLHDGFSHFLLLDKGFTPRQAGRIAQRLVEIETYRVMALLAFPVAKDTGRLVSRAEDELADLMDGMGQSRSAEDDRAVLARLSRLAAEVERSVGAHHLPFRAPPRPTTAWCASASTTCANSACPASRRSASSWTAASSPRSTPAPRSRAARTTSPAASHATRSCCAPASISRSNARTRAARADEPPRQDPAPPFGDG